MITQFGIMGACLSCLCIGLVLVFESAFVSGSDKWIMVGIGLLLFRAVTEWAKDGADHAKKLMEGSDE